MVSYRSPHCPQYEIGGCHLCPTPSSKADAPCLPFPSPSFHRFMLALAGDNGTLPETVSSSQGRHNSGVSHCFIGYSLPILLRLPIFLHTRTREAAFLSYTP
ncbi:MAG: hypothetical protein J5953_13595 [Prevotella sp.]|nr:hypothetical protein [Prevotella sp.]